MFVRLRGRERNKRHVTQARIEEKNIKLHTYKVAYTSPLTGKKERKWVPVDDITSLTLQREKQKQKAAKLSKRKKAQHHKRYYILMRKDYVQAIEDKGFELVYNPPGDDNCQFAALSHQVRTLGILRSPETTRKEIVAYLESNPYDSTGFPLLEHLADNEFASWNDYINHMARDGSYGDQLTLYAAANLYNIDIQIVSSLGAGGQHVFSPSASNSTATVYDVTGDYATENEGNTENEDDVGDSGDMVAEVALGGQKEQLRQNSDGSDMSEGEKEHITLQFVPDEDVGVLNLAPRMNSNYNIENLPNEVLEKIFKIVLMSSAIAFTGNACHAYQKLCGVNKRFRAVTRNLSSMLSRVYIRGGVQFRILRDTVRQAGWSWNYGE